MVPDNFKYICTDKNLTVCHHLVINVVFLSTDKNGAIQVRRLAKQLELDEC